MPRQTRQKGATERRAHAAAAESGLSWKELAERFGRDQSTLTRRLRQIDDDDRDSLAYETAEHLLRRIVKECRVVPDFFALSLSLPDAEPAGDVPDAIQPRTETQPDAEDEDEHGNA